MSSKIKLGQIERWDIDRIIPYDKNAKLHPGTHVKRISASIEEFTFLDPIAVDEDGIILEGHGRLKAAFEQGMGEVPVIQITGLSDAQKVAYRLAHNKLTMDTGFDPDMLKLDFQFLQDEGFDWDLTGFGELELSFLDEQEDEETNEPYSPKSSTQEVDVDEFKFDHKCPKCGFEYNDKK